MSLQETIAKNQKVVAVIAVVILALAGYRLMRSTGVVSTTPTRYFYNLDTGQTFVGPMSTDGIIAHVFACTSCDDPNDRFVGYIEKLTDAAKAEAVKEYPDLQVLTEGKVIALPPAAPGAAAGEEMQWVTLDSPAGGHITGVPYNKCDDPKPCKP